MRPDGVEVLLPRDTDQERAESFLLENEAWVLDQLAFIDRIAVRDRSNAARVRGSEAALRRGRRGGDGLGGLGRLRHEDQRVAGFVDGHVDVHAGRSVRAQELLG